MALTSDECVNEGRSEIYDFTTFIRDRIVVRTLGNGKPSILPLIFFHFDPVVTNSGYISMAVPSLVMSAVVCNVNYTKYKVSKCPGNKDGKSRCSSRGSCRCRPGTACNCRTPVTGCLQITRVRRLYLSSPCGLGEGRALCEHD
ncbi:uncharacterized protein K444DRAFT_74361 [Hyaloscypha bicolor E]|uniref:Uncharacterized protein n=1 Tax=Hyaloscypha bicolor E TaxID=1095630 RepID=A0A2J6SXW7_9HELO|nr:uncharacterized protein K444DRAFT_74361 [Hyaloscypha bicolor E]PMD55612.1 hypothetical protein K444DRAFT_74361 [Hyaloscypha bicolor E]